MCSPTIALSALALGGGTAAQVYGQRRAEKATERNMARAQSAEDRRQAKLRDERMGMLGKALESAGVEAADERIGEATDMRRQDYADVEKRFAEEGGYNTDPGTSGRRGPSVVQAEFDRESSEARDDLDQSADARARLASFGDANLSRALELTPIRERINTSANFARGSSSVLPIEMQAAYARGQRKGRGARLVGDILSGVGQAGLTSGAFSAATGAGGLVPNMQGQATPLTGNSSFISMY